MPVYEYTLERAWKGAGDGSAWVEALADRRLGRRDDAWRKAWKDLADSVYIGGLGTQTTLICARPTRADARKWTGRYQTPYDNATLIRIWKQMVAAARGHDTAGLDVITVGSQALGGLFVIFRDAFIRCAEAKDFAGAEEAAARMQDLIADVDALTACTPQYRLDGWLDGAADWGRSKAEKAYYRRNARRIVTTWGRLPRCRTMRAASGAACWAVSTPGDGSCSRTAIWRLSAKGNPLTTRLSCSRFPILRTPGWRMTRPSCSPGGRIPAPSPAG